jgi:signal transduction histidine kinase
MRISSYIFIAFIFIIAMFSTTTVLNFKLSSAVSNEAQYVNASTEIIRNSNRFQRNILDMVSGLRGYLLTGEKYFVESYDSAFAENQTILNDLGALITDSAQRKLLSEIQVLNNAWTDEYAEPLRQAKQMSVVGSENLSKFNKIYREKFLTGDERRIQIELRNKFRAFSNKEYSIRDRRKRELTSTAEQAKNVSLILVVVSVITAIVIVTVLVKRVSNRIGTMVKMANNISKGNYEVAVGEKGYKDELTDLESSLNHMSAELSKYIGLLKTKNEELDQYAHIVSHDMKGPLRGIGNVIGWIEEDHAEEMSEKLKEYIELIKKRIHRAEYLIESILAYARTDREKAAVEFVDTKDLLQDVVETIAPRPGIRINIDANLPTIITEKIALFQIFSNLVGNAVKYHDKSLGMVNIYNREFNDHYTFFIEDDGPGIEEQYFDKIFIAFQTLQERDSFESSGVGLAIVKKILDSRSEIITVNSKIGRGTTFSFTWSKQRK